MKSWLLALFAWLPAVALGAESVPSPPTIYLQAWLGALGTDSDSWKAPDAQTGDSVLGDLGTLPFGGGAGQKMWGGGAWQIGFEGGGLATWKSGNTNFRGTSSGGTNLLISVDSAYYSFGVFMGGVVSVNLARQVRLYVAGGPALTWAWLQDDGNGDSSEGDGIELDDDNDGSFVAYGRAGLECVLDNGFTFGVSVRYADDQFDFGRAGELTVDEPLYLLTLGARLRE
jgi:hypothetical protein